MTSLTNAEKAATYILDDIWGNRGFPVDPAVIAKELGLNVVEGSLPPNVSGALLKEAGKDPLVLLSETDSVNRKRFSCAHEVGHFIDRQLFQGEIDANDNHYEYVDLRGPSASNGTDPAEIFANQFAAELLMPRKSVVELYNQEKEAGLPTFAIQIKITTLFNVSSDAAGIRLKTLGLK